jgi:drug/metabolite transporter (DMT)-like permease
MPFLGELAAIGTSICFSIGPTLFTLAGRKTGSVVINRSRLLIASVILIGVHWIMYGTPLPFNAGTDVWIWFTLSGVLGLTLGDAALFQAFIMVGPRITMLIFSVSPIFAALIGWLFLSESISLPQILAISVTLAGIAWVTASQGKNLPDNIDQKTFRKGLFYAFLGAIGQTVGLFTAKMGLADNFSTVSGIVMRMVTATIAIWFWTILSKKSKETFQILKENPKALKQIIIATMIGPIVGVWLSLVSVQSTDLGIATTLQSLPPIFLLPISYYLFKEKISSQAVIGTLVAMVGVGLLFLV